jgi:hypothetical protein
MRCVDAAVTINSEAAGNADEVAFYVGSKTFEVPSFKIFKE